MKMNAILVGITMGLILLTLPAAASDYTLGIFRNANEDDTKMYRIYDTPNPSFKSV